MVLGGYRSFLLLVTTNIVHLQKRSFYVVSTSAFIFFLLGSLSIERF